MTKSFLPHNLPLHSAARRLAVFALAVLPIGLPAMAPDAWASGPSHGNGAEQIVFPREVTEYEEVEARRAKELGVEELSLWQTLVARVQGDPFNLVATIIFLLAIIHTFLASNFIHWAHKIEERHERDVADCDKNYPQGKKPVSFRATILHFLGEIEAIFGIWCVPLLIAITLSKGWNYAEHYIDTRIYTEPMFVVVIMAIASTRPVLRASERAMGLLAGIGKRTPTAWWLSILTVAPLLGSFITEPAAMTIAALLLSQQFYDLKPSNGFKYATLGLLFVNVSVGGTLTHFAAPPVLMVAGTWGWDLPFMFTNFGWRAACGIVTANIIYFIIFRKQFVALDRRKAELQAHGQIMDKRTEEEPVPVWIVLVHLAFLGWTVFTLHDPPLFIGGFLFFLAFTIATEHHQYDIKLKSPLLVGFFLAGLVTHGGLQGWWIAPVLSSFSEVPLFIGATILTGFNDNAAITFLASQVPQFSPQEGAISLEYAVVAGAVTGGGLTVIANAPNPAGQSILSRHFNDGSINPLGLLTAAIFPTLVMAFYFMVLPHL